MRRIRPDWGRILLMIKGWTARRRAVDLRR
jgi:hypothetical protein